MKDDPKVNGMFPANYVKLQDESDTAKTHRQRGDTVMTHDTTAELSEAEQEQRLLEEVDSTIKEWMKLSRSLLADSTKESAETNYFRIKSNIGMLLHLRGKLVSKTCSPVELGECKASLNKMLEGARRSQAGFLVPKTLHSMIQSGEKIHGPNFGIVGLYDMHYQMKKDFVDNSNVPERYPSKTMHQVSIEDAFHKKKTKILNENAKKSIPWPTFTWNTTHLLCRSIHLLKYTFHFFQNRKNLRILIECRANGTELGQKAWRDPCLGGPVNLFPKNF